MYRILCVSPHFVPRADSEAFCGGKFVLELLKCGIDVTVLCRDHLYPYAKGSDDSRLWEPLKEITVSIKTPADKQRFYSARLAVRYGIVAYARWVKAAMDAACGLFQKSRYDLVYSRALPMEANVAGYWIARRLGIPWIANINDPWDWHLFPESMRLHYPLHQRMISTFWMKKTLSAATLVTYPSTRLRDYHVRLSGIAHTSEIIPHVGYSANKKKDSEPGFRIVHAGKLGGMEKRPSDALLAGLSLFLKKHPDARHTLRLILVGPSDPKTNLLIEQSGLRPVVESTGRVSYERSLEYIASATICILVEGNLTEGIFLPSKLADYIAARKPVLALSPGDGVVADMLPEPGVARVNVDDPEAVAASLERYYRAYTNGLLDSCRPSERLVERFKPDVMARQFIDLVGRIGRPSLTQGREVIAAGKTTGL